MAYSDAQKKAVKKYNEKTYDEIKLRVRKGNKNLIKKYAESNNETVNGMLNRLLENEIPEMKDWFTAIFIYSSFLIILYPVYILYKFFFLLLSKMSIEFILYPVYNNPINKKHRTLTIE